MSAEPALEQQPSSDEERWHPPSVGADAGPMLTARQLEALQKQAWDEAFAEGQAAGFAEGQARVGEQVARVERIANALGTPFANLDDQVEQEVAALGIAIASQLLRHEMRTQPEQVIAIAREAMAALPVSAVEVTLHLCPEDAAVVEPALQTDQMDRRWKIQPDPKLSPGDCQVSSQYSRIDARLQTRLDALVSELLQQRASHAQAESSAEAPSANADD